MLRRRLSLFLKIAGSIAGAIVKDLDVVSRPISLFRDEQFEFVTDLR